MVELPKVHILVVDDNRANLAALEAILAELGQVVVTATSGADALRRLLEQDFAVIVLDVRMPDLDGFETARLMRARDKNRATPIIFLTAHVGSPDQILRAYELGAVDFLRKPVVPEILRSKVAVFVDLFHKTIEVQRQGELLRELERKEHSRALTEARQRWEAEWLRGEMERSRRIADALSHKNAELAVSMKERERADEALQQVNQRLLTLSETATQLLMGVAPGDVLAGTFAAMSAHMGLDLYVSYRFADGDDPSLAGWSGIASGDAEATLPLARRVAADRGRLLAEGEDAALADLRPLGVRALACFPLLAAGRLMGTLLFGTRRRARFDRDEIAFLQVCCDQVAMALDRARLVGELERRADELASSDRRKDEFLALLGHELRNPLAPLVTALQVLRLRKTEDPVVVKAEAAMERQLHHIVRLVDDLLDVSRISRGKIELRLAPVELSSVIDHALQTSRPLMQERGHRVEVEQPSAPVKIVVDATRLSQVISNLLNNAAKYTPEGGHIRLEAVAGDHDLTVRVRDDGIGVDPEVLPHLFDLFVQVQDTARASLGGLGIGLTLVKRLIELHGGTVSATSEGRGKGAEFVVSLPGVVVLSRAAAASTPDALEGDAAQSPLRIVVVEDNSDIRETLRDLLVMCGHEVEVAEDGTHGLEMVLSLKPNVALIDIGLPDVDGYRVAQALRTRMGTPATRLVALTGFGQPDDRRKALAAGFDAHLVKPVDLQRLSMALREPHP